MLTGIILVVAIIALIGCALLKSELTDERETRAYWVKACDEAQNSLSASRQTRFEEAKVYKTRLDETETVVNRLRGQVDELRGYMDRLTLEAQGVLANRKGSLAVRFEVVPTAELLSLRQFTASHFARKPSLKAKPARTRKAKAS